jgi:hypothetical protein
MPATIAVFRSGVICLGVVMSVSHLW